ncbi:MAG TPA: M3 family oligoendopeptidase [Caulobacteraceae bacterium]|jgi:oligoendopeptidase F|nr:M3 family oligoendopeptidase [Caulobacteraceae bacterium]
MNAPLASPPAADLPVWSLEDLYAGREDPRIEADLSAAGERMKEIARLEGMFIAARADAPALGRLIDEAARLSEAAADLTWALGAYASLGAATARDEPAWGRFDTNLHTRIAALSSAAVFLPLELNALEEAEIEAALAAVPAAARWRPWLRRIRAGRPHELNADLERLLLDKAPASANWVRLYDETLGRLTAEVEGERLTLSEALNRLSDPSPDRRRASAQGLATALGERADLLGLCLNTVAFDKQVEDRWRRFANPAASRHLANEVDAEAVQALETAVAGTYGSLSHRYYALKARALGRERLDHWDRNAPLFEAAPRIYDWREARGIVLDSFATLAPGLADRAAVFFEKPWVDARPRPGKQSGAFSHPVTAPRHPYVMLNYMGERRDVLTLAHELGHAVHQTLAAPNGTLLASTPLTLAETASIFAEGLVFERLLGEARGEDRKALIAGRIEDGLNTVTRQIAFHRFESRFHAARQEGELSREAIEAIWLDVMGESLGPAITLNPGYETYWAYVSHFVHAPFYVYAYAFGHLLVEALMAARRKDPTGFAPLYETLLAGGGTRTYVEALAPFGLNPRDPGFWRLGLSRLEALVDELEALL